MTAGGPKLDGLVPDQLRVRSSRILLDSLAVQADIGFHPYEVGKPQRLLVTVEIWLEDVTPPADDDPAAAWDYDYLRTEIEALAGAGRYNLQETLAHAIFQRFAAMRGVKALRVATTKPDIYDEARGVGVEITSFS
ncbi:MAG TPA: dihydroneopterin aldolase [Sphingomicrobium sp.]|nr:dihydroneopterin aldolase [Sphingomicrobium sp.]